MGERFFVRKVASSGYSLLEELENLRGLPRRIEGRKIPWGGGPVAFGRHILEPHKGLGQTLHIHMETLAPGGKSQKHGHQNEAMLYILEGHGYDIHDGIRYDWEAGDVMVVHNGCVHQHFNADSDHPAKILIIKTKPLYMFAGLWFQKNVEKPPKQANPGWEDFTPAD